MNAARPTETRRWVGRSPARSQPSHRHTQGGHPSQSLPEWQQIARGGAHVDVDSVVGVDIAGAVGVAGAPPLPRSALAGSSGSLQSL